MRNNGGNKHRASGCKSKGKIPGSSRKNHPRQWKAVHIEGFQGFDFSAGTLRNFGKNMSSSVQRKT